MSPMNESGLSRAELDALMELVEKPRGGGRSRPYEFGEAERLPARTLARVEATLDRAARAALKPLARLLRQRPFFGPVSLVEVEGGALLAELGESDLLYALPGAGSEGELGLLSLERRLGGAVADRLLGGRGDVSEPLSTATEAELALIRHFATAFVEGLGTEFQDLGPGGWSLGAREPAPRLSSLVGPRERLLSATFDLACGEVSGRIRLALPASGLEAQDPVAEAPVAEPRLTRGHPLSALPLPVSAVLDTVEISLRELLELEPGDVIPIGARMDSLIELRVGGVPKLTARAGCKDGQRVARIEENEDKADPGQEGGDAWQAA